MIIGVDEAGRGCWAGDVFAGAVILDPDHPITGLADSKVLSAKRREALAVEIKAKALAWGVGQATACEIDQVNILQATFLAMQRAVTAIQTQLNERGLVAAEIAYIDGNRSPNLGKNILGETIQVFTFIKGDALHPCISAASILAKVARDAQADEMDEMYPKYGFERHRGYGTALHRENLLKYGLLAEHRLSFKPMKHLSVIKST